MAIKKTGSFIGATKKFLAKILGREKETESKSVAQKKLIKQDILDALEKSKTIKVIEIKRVFLNQNDNHPLITYVFAFDEYIVDWQNVYLSGLIRKRLYFNRYTINNIYEKAYRKAKKQHPKEFENAKIKQKRINLYKKNSKTR